MERPQTPPNAYAQQQYTASLTPETADGTADVAGSKLVSASQSSSAVLAVPTGSTPASAAAGSVAAPASTTSLGAATNLEDAADVDIQEFERQ